MGLFEMEAETARTPAYFEAGRKLRLELVEGALACGEAAYAHGLARGFHWETGADGPYLERMRQLEDDARAALGMERWADFDRRHGLK